VALREAIAIGDDDFGALAPRLEELAARLLGEALRRQERAELDLVDQDDAAATYAEKITPVERRLDPSLPAIELERRVRGLTPHIGAYLELAGGDRLGVVEARAEDGALAAGAVDGEGGLRLGCGAGVLKLVRVRPAGGKAMDAVAYLRGHPLPLL
jgi:methionyl-tRNA formyltransferase